MAVTKPSSSRLDWCCGSTRRYSVFSGASRSACWLVDHQQTGVAASQAQTQAQVRCRTRIVAAAHAAAFARTPRNALSSEAPPARLSPSTRQRRLPLVQRRRPRREASPYPASWHRTRQTRSCRRQRRRPPRSCARALPRSHGCRRARAGRRARCSPSHGCRVARTVTNEGGGPTAETGRRTNSKDSAAGRQQAAHQDRSKQVRVDAVTTSVVTPTSDSNARVDAFRRWVSSASEPAPPHAPRTRQAPR